jgi:hypothetical protein
MYKHNTSVAIGRWFFVLVVFDCRARSFVSTRGPSFSNPYCPALTCESNLVLPFFFLPKQNLDVAKLVLNHLQLKTPMVYFACCWCCNRLTMLLLLSLHIPMYAAYSE